MSFQNALRPVFPFFHVALFWGGGGQKTPSPKLSMLPLGAWSQHDNQGLEHRRRQGFAVFEICVAL